MSYLLALAGNQNCGKTTLFNALTGANQHVGNFPGVTVEKKEGTIKRQKDAVLVDLPGIYSLSPYTSEEVVTRDFILKENPLAIINIVDATNIERNLYLTLQLMELRIPMVIALNMMDEVRASGNSIDVPKLSEHLGLPVVPISASKKEGISDLLDEVRKVIKNPVPPEKLDFCTGEVHKAIHSIAHIVEDQAKAAGYPLRFAATKLVEGDKPMHEALGVRGEEYHIVHHIIHQMERNLGTDREAALADMRYSYIEKICADCVIKHQETHEQIRSEKIDRLLTHKYLGIPIFFGIMFFIFWLTFGVIGEPLKGLLEEGIAAATAAFGDLLVRVGVSDWLRSLLIDGVCVGVGSVLSFLPIIVLLFFFLSILEDSGYMARVAFVMDKLLRKIGLSGRSFVPMLIGFGCSVPAIMATRTLASERDRKMTIVLTPFMSCSAKLPIYAMITAAFFPKNGALVMISLYLTGILVAVLSGLLLKRTLFQGEPVPFVMELPAYRIPSAKSVALHMWEKAKDFIRKAFTIIFLAAIIIWFLQSFDWRLNAVQNSADSILASIGSFIAPLFTPLGFGDWRASTALITGITAKETVVSTLTVLTGAQSGAQLGQILGTIFTPLSAFSFLAFTVLYMPCVAAFAAERRELGSTRGALLASLYQTGAAYVVALLIYQVGSLFIR
ncbi:ferrous iron transport protein B [Bittarella massiliensis (ex Durand et al. 2017)]|uniref:Ferrous iron transport protein B n=1 Tax=Bittarella massiliensis (ex Durand et al. 2017) TaxID=1720313 RepID=A0AAW5KHQ5_9FIRM|nr:ferrous iron transport protein B [Bittarella massiliensis (ex Durand et al. 2017)]MBC2872307.1 ferrous iron transport protein B [Bittarella massiliensis (ex Durand et al. 2017)]MCQ4949745.1 ferrous iron transport protein B [Bittarella massiliensis (ex Durand et al. 2017)]